MVCELDYEILIAGLEEFFNYMANLPYQIKKSRFFCSVK